MSDKTTTVSIGGDFFGLLAVLFIGLKLTGYITWSWWWVLSPIWGGLAIACVLLAILAVVALVLSR